LVALKSFNHQKNRITEIAIILHDGEKELDRFESLVNPERAIPYNITQITGIDDEMVSEAPKFHELARRVVEITEGAIFVAHNVRFDYGFLKEEFARLGYTYTRRNLCTVRLSRKVFPGLPGHGQPRCETSQTACQHYLGKTTRATRYLWSLLFL